MRTGVQKIGDFGIAKRQSGDTVELTKHNNISGSLAAMSPEQIRGDKLTPASDCIFFWYSSVADTERLSPLLKLTVSF